MEKEVIERYFGKSNLYDRLWSWDDCFEAFRESLNEKELAYRLAFYLASWGMYRGSSGLLQKNHRIHLGAVKIIKSAKYNDLRCSENKEVKTSDIKEIIALKDELSKHYSNITYSRGGNEDLKIAATDTLISKIILGCFGCVPAYDQFFLNACKLKGLQGKTFNEKSLEELFSYTSSQKNELTEIQDFILIEHKKYYPIMKIVDVYFWQLGYEEDLRNSNQV
jgi:hypothetical protein